MGRVYLAEEVREAFRRQLALKVIDRPWGASDRARRFRSEVRILASLEHPGIARFLEGGELPDGTLFLALEYVQGEDLLAFADQRGLSTDERVRLVVEVLGAVAYAHEQGVVHRDLKPANILVDRFGRTRLLDFGIAKLLDDDDADPHARHRARAPHVHAGLRQSGTVRGRAGSGGVGHLLGGRPALRAAHRQSSFWRLRHLAQRARAPGALVRAAPPQCAPPRDGGDADHEGGRRAARRPGGGR